MDISKARAIAAIILGNWILWANTKSQLALLDFQLEKITLAQSIWNNGATFAIAANNFQKWPKLSDFSIPNYRRANWDLLLIQKNSSELIMTFDWMLFKSTNKPNLYKFKKKYLPQNKCVLLFWIVVDYFWNCDWMLFKSTNKANLDKFQRKTSKNSCFLFQILLSNCSVQNPFKQLQKTGPQRVPPCRPLRFQL